MQRTAGRKKETRSRTVGLESPDKVVGNACAFPSKARGTSGDGTTQGVRGRSAAKRRDAKPIGSTEGGDGQPRLIAIKDIKTHPMFVDLLPVAEDLLEKMIQGMRAHGFYESEPVVLGIWPGLKEPVLIDGHMRIRAASETHITQVPFVLVEFESQMAALQHAMNLQAVRRRSTDGAYYRLCEQYDGLMERGRHKANGEAKELLTRVSNFVGRSASARRTAEIIGCHYRKVDQIRKIRRDGTPEIQQDVRNDKLTIYKAYKLIRDVELGEAEKGRRKLSAAQNKVVRSVLSEENLVGLEAMGDDIGSLLNMAVERFIGESREKERAEGRKG